MNYIVMTTEDVLDRKLEKQSLDLKEHMKLLTDPILQEVRRTNGRVSKNEDAIIAYKVWRGWMTGGMAIIMVVLPVGVAFLTWIAIQVINFDTRLRTAVDEAFDARIESLEVAE